MYGFTKKNKRTTRVYKRQTRVKRKNRSFRRQIGGDVANFVIPNNFSPHNLQLPNDFMVVVKDGTQVGTLITAQVPNHAYITSITIKIPDQYVVQSNGTNTTIKVGEKAKTGDIVQYEFSN